MNTPFKNICVNRCVRCTPLYSHGEFCLNPELVKKWVHRCEICRCEIWYNMEEVQICSVARNRIVIMVAAAVGEYWLNTGRPQLWLNIYFNSGARKRNTSHFPCSRNTPFFNVPTLNWGWAKCQFYIITVIWNFIIVLSILDHIYLMSVISVVSSWH